MSQPPPQPPVPPYDLILNPDTQERIGRYMATILGTIVVTVSVFSVIKLSHTSFNFFGDVPPELLDDLAAKIIAMRKGMWYEYEDFAVLVKHNPVATAQRKDNINPEEDDSADDDFGNWRLHHDDISDASSVDNDSSDESCDEDEDASDSGSDDEFDDDNIGTRVDGSDSGADHDGGWDSPFTDDHALNSEWEDVDSESMDDTENESSNANDESDIPFTDNSSSSSDSDEVDTEDESSSTDEGMDTPSTHSSDSYWDGNDGDPMNDADDELSDLDDDDDYSLNASPTYAQNYDSDDEEGPLPPLPSLAPSEDSASSSDDSYDDRAPWSRSSAAQQYEAFRNQYNAQSSTVHRNNWSARNGGFDGAGDEHPRHASEQNSRLIGRLDGPEDERPYQVWYHERFDSEVDQATRRHRGRSYAGGDHFSLGAHPFGADSSSATPAQERYGYDTNMGQESDLNSVEEDIPTTYGGLERLDGNDEENAGPDEDNWDLGNDFEEEYSAVDAMIEADNEEDSQSTMRPDPDSGVFQSSEPQAVLWHPHLEITDDTITCVLGQFPGLDLSCSGRPSIHLQVREDNGPFEPRIVIDTGSSRILRPRSHKPPGVPMIPATTIVPPSDERRHSASSASDAEDRVAPNELANMLRVPPVVQQADADRTPRPFSFEIGREDVIETSSNSASSNTAISANEDSTAPQNLVRVLFGNHNMDEGGNHKPFSFDIGREDILDTSSRFDAPARPHHDKGFHADAVHSATSVDVPPQYHGRDMDEARSTPCRGKESFHADVVHSPAAAEEPAESQPDRGRTIERHRRVQSYDIPKKGLKSKVEDQFGRIRERAKTLVHPLGQPFKPTLESLPEEEQEVSPPKTPAEEIAENFPAWTEPVYPTTAHNPQPGFSELHLMMQRHRRPFILQVVQPELQIEQEESEVLRGPYRNSYEPGLVHPGLQHQSAKMVRSRACRLVSEPIPIPYMPHRGRASTEPLIRRPTAPEGKTTPSASSPRTPHRKSAPGAFSSVTPSTSSCAAFPSGISNFYDVQDQAAANLIAVGDEIQKLPHKSPIESIIKRLTPKRMNTEKFQRLVFERRGTVGHDAEFSESEASDASTITPAKVTLRRRALTKASEAAVAVGSLFHRNKSSSISEPRGPSGPSGPSGPAAVAGTEEDGKRRRGKTVSFADPPVATQMTYRERASTVLNEKAEEVSPTRPRRGQSDPARGRTVARDDRVEEASPTRPRPRHRARAGTGAMARGNMFQYRAGSSGESESLVQTRANAEAAEPARRSLLPETRPDESGLGSQTMRSYVPADHARRNIVSHAHPEPSGRAGLGPQSILNMTAEPEGYDDHWAHPNPSGRSQPETQPEFDREVSRVLQGMSDDREPQASYSHPNPLRAADYEPLRSPWVDHAAERARRGIPNAALDPTGGAGPGPQTRASREAADRAHRESARRNTYSRHARGPPQFDGPGDERPSRSRHSGVEGEAEMSMRRPSQGHQSLIEDEDEITPIPQPSEASMSRVEDESSMSQVEDEDETRPASQPNGASMSQVEDEPEIRSIPQPSGSGISRQRLPLSSDEGNEHDSGSIIPCDRSGMNGLHPALRPLSPIPEGEAPAEDILPLQPQVPQPMPAPHDTEQIVGRLIQRWTSVADPNVPGAAAQAEYNARCSAVLQIKGQKRINDWWANRARAEADPARAAHIIATRQRQSTMVVQQTIDFLEDEEHIGNQYRVEHADGSVSVVVWVSERSDDGPNPDIESCHVRIGYLVLDDGERITGTPPEPERRGTVRRMLRAATGALHRLPGPARAIRRLSEGRRNRRQSS